MLAGAFLEGEQGTVGEPLPLDEPLHCQIVADDVVAVAVADAAAAVVAVAPLSIAVAELCLVAAAASELKPSWLQPRAHAALPPGDLPRRHRHHPGNNRPVMASSTYRGWSLSLIEVPECFGF